MLTPPQNFEIPTTKQKVLHTFPEIRTEMMIRYYDQVDRIGRAMILSWQGIQEAFEAIQKLTIQSERDFR